jgi:hypothetical protein
LEALLVSYDKVPFTCTYLPSENMKALAPIYAIAFVAGASLFAQVEHEVLYGSGMLGTWVTLGALYVLLRVAAARRTRLPDVEFDEAPATFQRLGLDG